MAYSSFELSFCLSSRRSASATATAEQIPDLSDPSNFATSFRLTSTFHKQAVQLYDFLLDPISFLVVTLFDDTLHSLFRHTIRKLVLNLLYSTYIRLGLETPSRRRRRGTGKEEVDTRAGHAWGIDLNREYTQLHRHAYVMGCGCVWWEGWA
jgi:hypothetical protein